MSYGISYSDTTTNRYLKTGTIAQEFYGVAVAISPINTGYKAYAVNWWICYNMSGGSLNPADAVISAATYDGAYTPHNFMYPNAINYDSGSVASDNNEYMFGGGKVLPSDTEYVLQFYYFILDASGNYVEGGGTRDAPILGAISCKTKEPGGGATVPIHPYYVTITTRAPTVTLNFEVPEAAMGIPLDQNRSMVYMTTSTGGYSSYYFRDAGTSAHPEFTVTYNPTENSYHYVLTISGRKFGYGRITVGVDTFTRDDSDPITTNAYGIITFEFVDRHHLLAVDWNAFISMFDAMYGAALPLEASAGVKFTMEMLNAPIEYYKAITGDYYDGVYPFTYVISTSNSAQLPRIVTLNSLWMTFEGMVNSALK